MAAGDRMLGGMAVVLSPNVPRLHVGDEIVPVPRHWLRRWFYLSLHGSEPAPRGFVRGRPIEHEQVVYAAGKLFVSELGYQQLRRNPSIIKTEYN